MTDWLHPEEFVPFAPRIPGEEINVHHCKQGKDNDRLYIKRTEDDKSIVAFCHHCGKRGYVPISGGVLRVPQEGSSLGHDQAADSRNREMEPATASASGEGRERQQRIDRVARTYQEIRDGGQVTDPEHWPASHREWVRQFLTDEEIKKHGIFYSVSRNVVVFPVDTSTDAGVYYNCRGWYGRTHTLPQKWDMVGPTGSPWPILLGARSRGTNHFNDAVVIVEDWLSALRVSTYVDVLCLGGCNKPRATSLLVPKDYRMAFVWLDMDNHQVRKNALKLARHLELYIPHVHIIETEQDPKAYSNEKILLILRTEN